MLNYIREDEDTVIFEGGFPSPILRADLTWNEDGTPNSLIPKKNGKYEVVAVPNYKNDITNTPFLKDMNIKFGKAEKLIFRTLVGFENRMFDAIEVVREGNGDVIATIAGNLLPNVPQVLHFFDREKGEQVRKIALEHWNKFTKCGYVVTCGKNDFGRNGNVQDGLMANEDDVFASEEEAWGYAKSAVATAMKLQKRYKDFLLKPCPTTFLEKEIANITLDKMREEGMNTPLVVALLKEMNVNVGNEIIDTCLDGKTLLVSQVIIKS